MTKKIVLGVTVFAALLASTQAAQARDLLQNATADVFVLGGASTLVDPQSWNANALYHTRMEVGYKYTIGVDVPYGKLLSIESFFTSGPNNLVLTNVDRFPHVGEVFPVTTYIGNVGALVHAPFSYKHFRPYADIGVEYDRFTPSDSATAMAKNDGWANTSTATLSHNDKFGMSFGIGLDRKIMKRVTFRIDVRDHVTGSPGFGIPPKPTVDSIASYPATGRMYNIVYQAGLVFHIGK